MPTYNLAQVKEHNRPDDVWFVIHNKVYDVTKYLEEHPGGSAILQEVAGRDATQEFEDVGHSEEANEWLDGLYIGDLPEEELAEEIEVYRPTFEAVSQDTQIVARRSGSLVTMLGKLGLTGSVGAAVWVIFQKKAPHIDWNSLLRQGGPSLPRPNGNMWLGIAVATMIQASASLGIAAHIWSKIDLHSGVRHKPRRVARPDRYVVVRRAPTSATQTPSTTPRPSVLDAKQYRPFKLIRKSLVAPNTYRFVFGLPYPDSSLGLPTGQHIALQAVINGKNVSRSYTPISNNSDLGRIELIVKVYQQGLMTQHLANMQVGQTIDIRGPKGSMQYGTTYAKRIGMIAGGSGITPMYQLIRAICADDSDNTQINLLYANNTEEDILLREELDSFTVQCPEKFKVQYVLAKPPVDWSGESGFITKDMVAKYLPEAAEDSKVLLCGPPPMIEATKKNLAGLGFEAPSAISKATDQVFLF
ncbi:NADH-cytochrome b-5 reductase [Truncatella angustata]|uniref:NADH-cytochrome b5 reductase 1 n=1 Tax=Truncatella angustata TaxID=152316 RepID=A0A9P8RKE2_9PEZI|nr:NADH-cytochrome b-5 reductase [Truncatella angustata]KAH6647675.1 NADH-cytochrome b-5 reductase [Truncatella angustata]